MSKFLPSTVTGVKKTARTEKATPSTCTPCQESRHRMCEYPETCACPRNQIDARNGEAAYNRLRDAAPDLLAACKGALLGFEAIQPDKLPFEWRILHATLKAAIAKAEAQS